MAEKEGFEPSRQLPAYTLSKRAPSATRPPLLKKMEFPPFLSNYKDIYHKFKTLCTILIESNLINFNWIEFFLATFIFQSVQRFWLIVVAVMLSGLHLL